MKKLLKKTMLLCAVSVLSLAMAVPAMAAAPHREFRGMIPVTRDDGTRVQLEVYIPKYIGSFSTKIPLSMGGNQVREIEWKIAVVRANPESGYQLWHYSGEELRQRYKNSIVLAMREYPNGQTVDNFDGRFSANNGTYFWDEAANAFTSEAGGSLIFASNNDNPENDAQVYIEEGSGYISAIFGYGVQLDTGFNAILPLTEEQEARFLETGAIYTGFSEWEKHIDLSGLKDVLLNQSSIPTSGEVASAAPKPNAKASASNVIINGKAVSFEAYNIDGSNYFKLRDVAAALNGTTKQFNLKYNQEKNAVELLTGNTYTMAGGELEAGDRTDKHAEKTNMSILLNNQEVSLPAYNIKGNNYCKIRDLGEKIGFSVTWNEADNAIHITTN